MVFRAFSTPNVFARYKRGFHPRLCSCQPFRLMFSRTEFFIFFFKNYSQIRQFVIKKNRDPQVLPLCRYSAPAVAHYVRVREKRGIEGVRRTEGVPFSGFAFFLLQSLGVFFSFRRSQPIPRNRRYEKSHTDGRARSYKCMTRIHSFWDIVPGFFRKLFFI